jgi:hypothetical protein
MPKKIEKQKSFREYRGDNILQDVVRETVTGGEPVDAGEVEVGG